MLSERVLGNLKAIKNDDLEVEYVDIEWHETFKRLHKKKTDRGNEIGIRLGNEILSTGLKEGDVLYLDQNSAAAVRIPSCQAIVVQIDGNHRHMLAKVCYEIGNKHAALFWGERDNEVVTPYNEPTYKLLAALHGVQVEVKTVKLDMEKSIASTVHSHTH